MKAKQLFGVSALCLAAFASGAASGATMHPTLGARISGMGESGIVNLTVNAPKRQLCWNFDLSAKGLTAASIRDQSGMAVASLGTMYMAKGCAAASTMALDEIETKPASYHVWVDTAGHPGDLRGTLFAGMATMSHM
jgi:hypothetical protein